MKDKLKKLFKNKLKSEDKINEYDTTPSANEGWNNAVKEAKGYGIPISSFGDTEDKMVFHPGHLGYDFNYHWGEEKWTNEDCWEEHVDKETKIKALKELLELGIELNDRFDVDFLYVSGTKKGYLSSRLYTIDEIESDNFPDDEYEYVMFVYGISRKYMKKRLEN